MNFPFVRPFIQWVLNTDTVPGFVREASTLAPGSSRLCSPVRAGSLFNYFSALMLLGSGLLQRGLGSRSPWDREGKEEQN